MSSQSAIYLKTSKIEEVVKNIQDFSGISEVNVGQFPEDLGMSFLMAEDALPNYYVVGLIPNNACVIFFNSSRTMSDLLDRLTKSLECTGLMIIAQSTVSYYHITVTENGNKLREVKKCYGDDIEEIDFGNYFDFEEKEGHGTRVEYDGEVDYVVDWDYIQNHLKSLGIVPEFEVSEYCWHILKGEQTGQTMDDLVKHFSKMQNGPKSKPWWKFW